MYVIVMWWKRYYLFDGSTFYGPFHSENEALFRVANLKDYKLEQPLKRYKVVKQLQYS